MRLKGGTMNVTSIAIEKLKEVINQEEQASSLRVVAMPADHGGLQYMLTMEKETQDDDTVMSLDGVDFVMDSDSAPFLEEATIDYIENFGGQVGFVINNPLYASAGGGCGGGGGCGCGGGGRMCLRRWWLRRSLNKQKFNNRKRSLLLRPF